MPPVWRFGLSSCFRAYQLPEHWDSQRRDCKQPPETSAPLEVEFCGQLNGARADLGTRYPGGGGIHRKRTIGVVVEIKIRIILNESRQCTVHEVEGLRANLQVSRFAHLEILEETDLIVFETRPMNVRYAIRSKTRTGRTGAQGRRLETVGIEVLAGLEIFRRVADQRGNGGFVRSSHNHTAIEIRGIVAIGSVANAIKIDGAIVQTIVFVAVRCAGNIQR